MHPHLADLDARLAALLQSPQLMGIVNITPNSFSDGSTDPAAAIACARQAVADGASIVDLGAEASSFFRPGVTPVDPAEQLRRLIPVMQELRDLPALMSVDTRSAAVAKAAVAAGAHIINDVSAGTHDPAMLDTVAALGVPIVLMHIAPCYPDNPGEDDAHICATVRSYLLERAAAAQGAGIRSHRILLDPGIGFGKTPRDNMILALKFPHYGSSDSGIPYPIVLGISRKRFLTFFDEGKNTMLLEGQRRDMAFHANLATHERDVATAAIVRYHDSFAPRPAGLIHRVHNVPLCAKALALGYNPPA